MAYEVGLVEVQEFAGPAPTSAGEGYPPPMGSDVDSSVPDDRSQGGDLEAHQAAVPTETSHDLGVTAFKAAEVSGGADDGRKPPVIPPRESVTPAEPPEEPEAAINIQPGEVFTNDEGGGWTEELVPPVAPGESGTEPLTRYVGPTQMVVARAAGPESDLPSPVLRTQVAGGTVTAYHNPREEVAGMAHQLPDKPLDETQRTLVGAFPALGDRVNTTVHVLGGDVNLAFGGDVITDGDVTAAEFKRPLGYANTIKAPSLDPGKQYEVTLDSGTGRVTAYSLDEAGRPVDLVYDSHRQAAFEEDN